MSSNNQSLAMQRIAKLVDENSFMEIGSLVTARSTDFNLTAAKLLQMVLLSDTV